MFHPIVQKANREDFRTIKGPRTGRSFNIRELTYGVLDTNPESPLSCVSVTNSSLSIDLWKGCSWQCSYCHAQGSMQDLDKDTLTMPDRPLARSKFSIKEIVDALKEHPFFEPDQSIISIGSSTTEPLAYKQISESTFEIMECLAEKGYKNPFWVITKAGFPIDYKNRLSHIVSNGNPCMISFCWANNPKSIEPKQNNRFKNIAEAHKTGAATSWYFRPIAEGWSSDPKRLEDAFKKASKYADSIDMIVPGGLRWTEGIEYGVSEVRGLAMPEIAHDDNVKELSDEVWDKIFKLAAQYLPDTPVYKKSSCALSKMLNRPSINLVQLKDPIMCNSSLCPNQQRDVCRNFVLPDKKGLNTRLAAVGLSGICIDHISPNGEIETCPSFNKLTFALKQMVTLILAEE